MKWNSVKTSLPPSGKELIVLIPLSDKVDAIGEPYDFIVRCCTYAYEVTREGEERVYCWRKWDIHGEVSTSHKLLSKSVTHWAYAPTFNKESDDSIACICKKLRKLLRMETK